MKQKGLTGHFMTQQLVCCIHHNSWCWIASDAMETKQ